MIIKELWISITKKNPTNTSKIPTVLDVLSPIESSCSSLEQNNPAFQEEIRASGNKGFDAGSYQDKDKTDMTILGVLIEGTDLVNFDPKNGVCDNEDFSEHFSMFGVDMEKDEHVCFDAKNPVDSDECVGTFVMQTILCGS
jgi:hypothetical protein